MIEAVFFDVGETLVDETGVWGRWADWLEVPRLTFFAVLGAVIARDGDHREVFRYFKPGVDFEELRRAYEVDVGPLGFTLDDLYPDVRSCFEALVEHGYRLGIAANQPPAAEAVLERSGLPFDWLVISSVVGLDKPAPEFFAHLCRVSGLPPERIAYVGDRVDNDVVPAASAGMVAVHLRRGPWGELHQDRPELALARLRVESLDELPDRLDSFDV